jgi:Fur family transcriptional regulator, iron response regulator
MDGKPVSREDVAERLRRCDINLTHQRVEIAYVLFSRMEHMSADQILVAVNQPHASTSKATVYNTLKLFCDRKLIREVIVDSSRAFYDPNTAPHYHLYDLHSGRLTDIPEDQVRITGLPSLPAGMVAEGIDIIVRARPAIAPVSADECLTARDRS